MLGDSVFVDYQNPCAFPSRLFICAVVDCHVTGSVRYCTNVVNIVVSLFLIGVRVLTTPCDLIVLPLRRLACVFWPR